VTSSFSNSRKHPVYGFHRAHTGVDFGAPTGTRVKATGEAIVKFAGRRGGYGNLVILRHPNGYETYYAHLDRRNPPRRGGRKRIGEALCRGRRSPVEQGQRGI
jgi:murein DD-endopeptidase MepM/ murein hydrolase activator NlpD